MLLQTVEDHEALETDPYLKVSVVIPARGRPELLRRCLRILQAQEICAGSFEILVCDHEPSDRTLEIVESLMRKRPGGPLLRYLVPRSGHGVMAARDWGWKHARAPIIAFTDDDIVPASDWLERGLQALSDGVHAVSGQIMVQLSTRAGSRAQYPPSLSRIGFTAANCFVRREALEIIGGFEQGGRAGWHDDSSLQRSLIEAGLKIVSTPEVCVLHPAHPAGMAASLARPARSIHPGSWLINKAARFYPQQSLDYSTGLWLLTVISAVIALMAVAGGKWLTAGMAFSFWLLMTVWFFTKRFRASSWRMRQFGELFLSSVLALPFTLVCLFGGLIR